ncbi:HD domain-containing protein [Winogradskyella ouciana]|uniref:HD domain-containing protein n=1 Tax=Winogradskyella ouciana TaxID=2608631 RepID=UPI003D2C7674
MKRTELKPKWVDLVSNYTDKKAIVASLWEDIVNHYSNTNRYYHNLAHIQNMLSQAEDFKSHIEDYDVLVFAIWYHDIIYKSTKKDNEVKSALFAKKALKSLNFNEKRIENIENLIISTKKHQIGLDENDDNAYLLDFDLSILGTDWETYQNYTQQIRREYKIYPDFMYKPGRKKVLQHFLERETLYFTEVYQDKFETQARENIIKELKLL